MKIFTRHERERSGQISFSNIDFDFFFCYSHALQVYGGTILNHTPFCLCVSALNSLSYWNQKKKRKKSSRMSVSYVLCVFWRGFILSNLVTLCVSEWSFQHPEPLLSLFVPAKVEDCKSFCFSMLASLINSIHIIADTEQTYADRRLLFSFRPSV